MMQNLHAQTLWKSTGLRDAALKTLTLSPSEEADASVLSSFKIGPAAQTSIGLSALAAAEFHALRTSVYQDIKIEARKAALEFRSEAWYTLDGVAEDRSLWDPIAGLYRTRDGYVRIHTNFPHHRRGILFILGLQDSPNISKKDVQDALSSWDSVQFETTAAEHNMCATALRSFSEWDSVPHALSLRHTPPITLHRIGDAPQRVPDERFTRPLEGIKVLELTRVIAGPVAGRTLAAHGADVLLVTSPNLPALPLLDADTSRGKRTTQLNLTTDTDKLKLRALAKDADVFLQGYRPGGLEDKGFGPAELAKLRPGIVYASLNAWGWEGPWKNRRGFDSLVQTATGFNVAEAEAFGVDEPKALPVQAIDHAAGYLLTFGINAALCKTITEGGSWEVRVSLAAVGQWLRSLGRNELTGKPLPSKNDPEILALLEDWEQADGSQNTGRRMKAIKHSAELSKTPVKVGTAPVELNMHAADWIRM